VGVGYGWMEGWVSAWEKGSAVWSGRRSRRKWWLRAKRDRGMCVEWQRFDWDGS